MNMTLFADALILGVLLLLVWFAWRRRRKGCCSPSGSSCSGKCASCSKHCTTAKGCPAFVEAYRKDHPVQAKKQIVQDSTAENETRQSGR